MSTPSKRSYRRISPTWHNWNRGLRKLRTTIRGLRENPSMHNQRWRDNTIAHYEKIEFEMLANEPSKYIH